LEAGVAIDYAVASIEQAKLAVLDAVSSRAEAEREREREREREGIVSKTISLLRRSAASLDFNGASRLA
jgi:hypothetical protein